MSDLPAIDSMLDEAICRCREVRNAGINMLEIEHFLKELVVSSPHLAIVGMGFHLGMLLLVRQDCYRDENGLE